MCVPGPRPASVTRTTSAGSHRSTRTPSPKAQTEAAGWHCQTPSNAHLTPSANMLSALELVSLSILQCLPLSEEIHHISLPSVASRSQPNHSACHFCLSPGKPSQQTTQNPPSIIPLRISLLLFKLLCIFLGSRTPSLLNNVISHLDLEHYH